MFKVFSIGQAARETRLSPSTLRNWENAGLIPAPTKLRGRVRIRLYSEDDIKNIRALRKKRLAS